MRYAETGFNLEIDLSRGNLERVETDPRLTELHLGGQGTTAKIQWDRVPPESTHIQQRSFTFNTYARCQSYRC
jgi:aldehyde:ferredoxin oxidoreductase